MQESLLSTANSLHCRLLCTDTARGPHEIAITNAFRVPLLCMPWIRMSYSCGGISFMKGAIL